MPNEKRDLKTEVEWRRAQLIEAGFPRPLAARLAQEERHDLHELIELVEQGCAPALAVRLAEPKARHAP